MRVVAPFEYGPFLTTRAAWGRASTCGSSIRGPAKAPTPTRGREPLEEIYYFTQGQGRIWIGDDHVDVAAGDAILVPAGVPHGFENNGTSPLRVVLFFGKPQADQPPYQKQSRSGDGT